MAHAEGVRTRARSLYLAGLGRTEIAKRVRVGPATLSRWVKTEGWAELRKRQRLLERSAGELALEMALRAAVSGDPQQAFAAKTAADLAQLHQAREAPASTEQVAKALLEALAEHPVLGPLVRKHRQEVIEAVLAKVENAI